MIHIINAVVFILVALYIWVLNRERIAQTKRADANARNYWSVHKELMIWRSIAQAHAAELDRS